MPYRIKLLFLLGSAFLFTSCTDYFFSTSGGFCPFGFKVKTIKVVDRDSNPVTGAEFRVVNTRTGKEFCVNKNGNRNDKCDSLLGEIETANPGEYILISEYNTASNQPTADVQNLDVIEATIKKNGLVVKPRYIVIFEDSYCFPDRVKGPEIVVLE